MIADLENFEGNAQTFRILAKALHGSDLNVSYSVISTLIKYPVNSCSFDYDDPNVMKHKMGYYLAEEETFNRVVNEVETRSKDGQICRHPLTFLLEAADDIAYRTADIEDAFKKRLFTFDQFVEFFENKLAEYKRKGEPKPHINCSKILIEELKRQEGERKSEGDAFNSWVRYARGWFMHNTIFRFSKEYNSIMAGSYTNDLFHDINHSLSMEILGSAMKEYVYDSNGILRLEVAAQTTLSFLLDHFVRAVLYYDNETDGFKPSETDRKLLNLLSENYKNDYKLAKQGHENDEGYCLYLRLLMVVDYISGMTDSFARTLHRELSGIE